MHQKYEIPNRNRSGGNEIVFLISRQQVTTDAQRDKITGGQICNNVGVDDKEEVTVLNRGPDRRISRPLSDPNN